MKRRAKSIFYLLFFNVLTIQVYAQFLKPPVSIPSPNAATLGQFGDVPVSLFTGLPTIDIPLHTFQEGDIKVPISLGYHASGVRPDQHPGWTGMNWNLNTAGVISRKINDLQDEYNYPNIYKGANAGYYFNHAITSPSTWDTKAYIVSLIGQDNGDKDVQDTSPDEFSFNFLNYSGKFYLDNLGQWKVKSDANLKVVFDGTFIDPPFTPVMGSMIEAYGGYLKTFKGFTITDEAGTQYIFGGSTDAIEYSMPFYGQKNSFWIANSWNLTQIKTVEGQEVTFTYGHVKATKNGVLVRNEFINSMYISIFYKKFSGSGGGFLAPNCSEDPYLIPPSGAYGGELISPVYLESMEGTNAKIVFNRSTSTELRYRQSIYDIFYNEWVFNSGSEQLFPFLSNNTNYDDYPNLLNNLQWRKLDNFQVFRKGEATPIKQVDFTYNNNSTQRLMLLAVQQKGGGKVIPPYQFFYNTSVALPDYLADHTDHWGFYNGNKSYTYSKDPANFIAYYNYRQPDAAYMQAGILTKVSYPTGGLTEMQYEPHTYSKGVDVVRNNPLIAYSGNPIAGGLRIKKLINYESTSLQNPIEKTYYYVANYTAGTDPATLSSSGILGGSAKYYWDDYVVYADNDPGLKYKQFVFSTHSILPSSSNSQGSHIGYSEVVEKLSDGSYTIRKYTNFDNGHLDESLPATSVLQPTRTIYDPYIDKSIERGNLLEEEIRNPQNEALSKKVITYKVLSSDFVRAITVSYFNVCPGSASSIFEGYAFKYYFYQYKLDKEENYVYDQQDQSKSVMTSNTYSYYSNGLVSEMKNIQSNGSEISTRFKYPADVFTASSGSPTTDVPAIALKKMKDLNMSGVVVEKQVWEKPSGQTTYQLIEGNLTKFKEFYTNQVFPFETYSYRMLIPVTTSTATLVTAGVLQLDSYNPGSNDFQGYQRVASYSNYDTEGNVLSFRPENDATTSYIWGYGNSLPIAEIKNAQANQVFHTSFEETTANVSTDSQTGKKSYSAAYTVNVPSAGTYMLTYWRKLSSGNWELIQQPISGATTIGGVGTLIDEVRVFPKGAEVTTYTYDPIIGITSATDPNNVTIYYEYDGLQRLQYVKDQDGNIVKSYVYHYKN